MFSSQTVKSCKYLFNRISTTKYAPVTLSHSGNHLTWSFSCRGFLSGQLQTIDGSVFDEGNIYQRKWAGGEETLQYHKSCPEYISAVALFCSVMFCSALFCYIMFRCVVLCCVVFCSVLFCSVLAKTNRIRSKNPLHGRPLFGTAKRDTIEILFCI